MSAKKAIDPNTPPEELRALCHEASLQQKRLLAANPSTPTDVLYELSLESDKYIRRYVAENPSTLTQTLAALYEASDPRLDEIVQAEVARNPSTPRPLLIEISRLVEAWPALRVVFQNRSLTPVLLPKMLERGSPAMRAGWLGLLAKHSNPAVVEWALKQPDYKPLEVHPREVNRLPVRAPKGEFLAKWRTLRHPDGRVWSATTTGHLLRLRIVNNEGDTITKRRKLEDAPGELERMVQELLLEGFEERR